MLVCNQISDNLIKSNGRPIAKPKIDPFEFSRDLEEGMRTVVVCTVVSGQSFVDIK